MNLTEEWLRVLDGEATERSASHAPHASQRPLSLGYELVGLVGEAQFASDFQLPLNFGARPGGDGRVDFVLPMRFTVDVKTARKPLHLIEEQGKVVADIYVLAGYDDEHRAAEMLGWELGNVLRRAPVRDFGHGIINHYIPRAELRPMD